MFWPKRSPKRPSAPRISTYIDGKEHGEYKVYRDNGAYLYTGHYDHGICVGEWKKYSKEGKVIKTVIPIHRGSVHIMDAVFNPEMEVRL